MNEYADYIVFVDESGDHGLDQIDEQFPVFSLAFCVIEKNHYRSQICPELQALKFKFWGHDAVVFHERDIRKQNPPYGFLRTDAKLRDDFFSDINSLIDRANFGVYSSIIDKKRLKERYKDPYNPYEIALLFCMEKILIRLCRYNQHKKMIHVIFESRGKKEDAQLELEFRRIVSNQANWGYKNTDFSVCAFEPMFISKQSNCAGLQIADLMARPLALKAIRPTQPNRTYDILRSKLGGQKIFP